MKIVDRYILTELVQPFLFGIFAFTSIFVGSDVLINLAQKMMKFGLPLLTAVKLFFLQLPQIIVWTFPMSMLLAALLSFGRLAGDSEIVALQAGGVSFIRLMVPVLIVAVLVTGVAIFFDNNLVPASQQAYERIIWRVKHGKKLPKTQKHLRVTPIDGQTGKIDFILTAELFDGREKVLRGVTYSNYEAGNLVQIIQAEKAIWKQDRWVFVNGTNYIITDGGRVPRTSFARLSMKNKIARNPQQLARNQQKPSEMTLSELWQHIQLLEKEGQNVKKLKVTYHQRYAIPFACFIFALVGAPLGLKNQSGSSIGLGISIIIIFIYYTLMTVGGALGQSGTLAPWLGAWIQNIVFTVVGLGLVYRANK